MSSLLRKTMTLARPAPGQAWLVALVAVGLLTTAFSLAAAGRALPGVTSLTTAAQHTAARQPATARAATSSGQAMSGASMTSAAPTSATKTVEIKNYAFSPATLTVNVGDTVTWTNKDTAPHT